MRTDLTKKTASLSFPVDLTQCFFLPFFGSNVIVQTVIWQKALTFLKKKFTWLSRAVMGASTPVGTDTYLEKRYLTIMNFTL